MCCFEYITDNHKMIIDFDMWGNDSIQIASNYWVIKVNYWIAQQLYGGGQAYFSILRASVSYRFDRFGLKASEAKQSSLVIQM